MGYWKGRKKTAPGKTPVAEILHATILIVTMVVAKAKPPKVSLGGLQVARRIRNIFSLSKIVS